MRVVLYWRLLTIAKSTEIKPSVWTNRRFRQCCHIVNKVHRFVNFSLSLWTWKNLWAFYVHFKNLWTFHELYVRAFDIQITGLQKSLWHTHKLTTSTNNCQSVSDSDSSYNVRNNINFLAPEGGENFVHPPDSRTACFTFKIARRVFSCTQFLFFGFYSTYIWK